MNRLFPRPWGLITLALLLTLGCGNPKKKGSQSTGTGIDEDLVPLAADTWSESDGKTAIPSNARFVVDIPSDRGVTLSTVVIAPQDPPRAAVILLEGDDGFVSVTGTAEDPVITSQGFLARSADLFAEHGILVALPDVPSDYPDGIDLDYRIGEELAVDMSGILEWIQAQDDLPVWLVGMSKGSFSATNGAVRLNSKLGGFALCSGSTAPPSGSISETHPNGVLDLALDTITVPAVIVGHEEDACPGTPGSGVADIGAALTASSHVTEKLFTGGSSPQGNPCGPSAAHGFIGMEADVIEFLASKIAPL